MNRSFLLKFLKNNWKLSYSIPLTKLLFKKNNFTVSLYRELYVERIYRDNNLIYTNSENCLHINTYSSLIKLINKYTDGQKNGKIIPRGDNENYGR